MDATVTHTFYLEIKNTQLLTASQNGSFTYELDLKDLLKERPDLAQMTLGDLVLEIQVISPFGVPCGKMVVTRLE